MFSRVKSFFSFAKYNGYCDFKTIFMPIYIPLTWNGIFPYSVSFKLNGCKIIKKSIYFNTLRAVTVNLIILAFNLINLQRVVVSNTQSNNFTNSVTALYNYILEILNLHIVVIAIYLCAYKNGSNYIKMLNTIASSWNELPRYGNRVLGKLYIQVNICIAIIITILIVMTFVNFSRDDTFWHMTLSAISFNLPMLIQYMMILFYCCLILMIVATLEIINENCLNIIKDSRSPMGYFIKVENRCATVTLRHLEQVYVKVMETKTEINTAFEAPILLTLLQCFHSMVSEAYIIFTRVVVKQSFTLHDTINCSLWLFYQALKVYALSFTGSKLKWEAIKIARNLHNIPVDKKNQRMFMEIQHFSTLISYQSADLSVYGFFPIDATLLFNVLASAAMYLVILLQFEKDD